MSGPSLCALSQGKDTHATLLSTRSHQLQVGDISWSNAHPMTRVPFPYGERSFTACANHSYAREAANSCVSGAETRVPCSSSDILTSTLTRMLISVTLSWTVSARDWCEGISIRLFSLFLFCRYCRLRSPYFELEVMNKQSTTTSSEPFASQLRAYSQIHSEGPTL
jgi:hypothetical protein